MLSIAAEIAAAVLGPQCRVGFRAPVVLRTSRETRLPGMHTVPIGKFSVANDRPFTLIAGPCALESRAHALEMSAALKEITGKLGINLVYKTSFDKANRTSASAERGLGLEKSLPILAEVRESRGIPVLTDVHTAEQCAPTAEAVDVLQIPAFLCRQTDLLVAAGKTGKAINVKKGQFAQALALGISESNAAIELPAYLKSALDSVTAVAAKGHARV